MVIAFLLAQFVLPGLPSSPIQPPGMICASGSCERGPMVYRTSASKSRLVVACDMRSNTCSDGRQITTIRPTPVPCETSPGVWEMVPEDTGCYSVRGLESWAANTSYLSWGAELDRSPWGSRNVESVQRMDGFTRVCTYDSNGGRYQISALEPVEGEWHTLACIARANTQNQIRLQNGDGIGEYFPLGAEWSLFSRTSQMPASASAQVSVYNRFAGCTDVIGCWLTRTDTPGRACWGGEAPVTCAADRHTIGTEGWPTESVEISAIVSWQKPTPHTTTYIIDSRTEENLNAVRFYVSGSIDGSRLSLALGTNIVVASPVLEWEVGRDYAVSVRRNEDGTVTLRRDGMVLAQASGPALSWGDIATLGAQRTFISTQYLDGSIRSLTVRSYEEVSP